MDGKIVLQVDDVVLGGAEARSMLDRARMAAVAREFVESGQIFAVVGEERTEHVGSFEIVVSRDVPRDAVVFGSRVVQSGRAVLVRVDGVLMLGVGHGT